MAHTRPRNKRKRQAHRPFIRPGRASWESWEVAALHEAAHAVLAEHVGVPVQRISLSIEPRGDTACTVAGATRYEDIRWNESDTPAMMRALTLAAMAGRALENVLGLPTSEYDTLGERTVWGKVGATDLSAAHAHLDEIASAHGIAWTPADREALVAAATARAEAFVREHIDTIEAVGTALLQKARRVLLAPNAPTPTHWRVSMAGDELRALLDRPVEAVASTSRHVAASSA